MKQEYKAFHLGLTKKDLDGATLAIIPGDPARVEKIAQFLDSPKKLKQVREFHSYKGKIDNHTVIVCSTGIGGPSTSICVEELACLGIKDFIRIGTTGAIQKNINVGDAIITSAAVRLDATSDHFAPIEYPAVANFDIIKSLQESANEIGLTSHIGVTASSASFYPGQERYDTFSGYVTQKFQGSMKEWQALKVLNYEMESATLYTVCATLGLRAGCVAGVIINRTKAERVEDSVIHQTEEKVIKIGISTARKILK